MIALYDDRVIQVGKNTGRVLDDDFILREQDERDAKYESLCTVRSSWIDGDATAMMTPLERWKVNSPLSEETFRTKERPVHGDTISLLNKYDVSSA